MRMHDPSTIIQCGDEFWIFCTGIRTPSFRSRDLRTWTPAGPVNLIEHSWIADAVPGSRDRNYWAPDIIKVQVCPLHALLHLFLVRPKHIGHRRDLQQNPRPRRPLLYSWTDGGLLPVFLSARGGQLQRDRPRSFSRQRRQAPGSHSAPSGSGIKLIELDFLPPAIVSRRILRAIPWRTPHRSKRRTCIRTTVTITSSPPMACAVAA